MAWSVEHRAFVVEKFIQNGGSPIMTQRAFRFRFALRPRDPVPDKKTIHNWVSNFRQTGSALKRKSPGRPRTATGPEAVAAVRASIERSPRRSARKHADALRLSDRSVRRILHRDLGGCSKAQVYQHRPQTLEGLKEAITQEVAAIPAEMTFGEFFLPRPVFYA
jgi:transposase